MAAEPRDRAPLYVRIVRGGFYRARFALVVCVGKGSELVAWIIDSLLGVDTGGFLEARTLRLASPDAHGFAPSPWFTLCRILPRSEVADEDVFLDIGAGKGRMVLSAALWYPFRRVIGIELSPDLAGSARRNLDRVAPRLRRRDVEIVEGDASVIPIADDVTIIYAYDPFEGQLFTQLIVQMLASLDRRPRRLRLIYRTPLRETELLGTGRARLVRRVRGRLLRWDADWPGLALFELT
jgi:SAM-dependent methyltransferase